MSRQSIVTKAAEVTHRVLDVKVEQTAQHRKSRSTLPDWLKARLEERGLQVIVQEGTAQELTRDLGSQRSVELNIVKILQYQSESTEGEKDESKHRTKSDS